MRRRRMSKSRDYAVPNVAIATMAPSNAAVAAMPSQMLRLRLCRSNAPIAAMPPNAFAAMPSQMLRLRLCRPDVRRGFASPFAGVREMGLRPSFGLRPKRWASGRTWGVAPIVFLTLRRGRASPHIGAAKPLRTRTVRLLMLDS